jgi:hypothetical protein
MLQMRNVEGIVINEISGFFIFIRPVIYPRHNIQCIQNLDTMDKLCVHFRIQNLKYIQKIQL